MLDLAYQYLHQSFTNGHILSLDELLVLLDLQTSPDHLLQWYSDMIDLSYLSRIPEVHLSEVFINSSPYYTDTNNHKFNLPLPLSEESLLLHFSIVTHRHQVEWNYNSPYTSFHIKVAERSMRLTLIHPSVTPNKKVYAFFRNISAVPYSTDSFFQDSPPFTLKELVSQKQNILICGSTGSGKTSFLSSLLTLVEEREHIIMLEDTKELIPTSNTT